tara:strand:- start:191966 stop:192154 length:189 start_codon:yes stop_codon:yes gene_type:complete
VKAPLVVEGLFLWDLVRKDVGVLFYIFTEYSRPNYMDIMSRVWDIREKSHYITSCKLFKKTK